MPNIKISTEHTLTGLITLHRDRSLERRKGGDGHGSSGHGGSSDGSHGDSSDSTAHGGTGGRSGSTVPAAFKSSPASKPFSLVAGGAIKGSASAYSNGGGSRFKLSSETPFSGRQAGGGTRDDIYGTRIYGSGYPYGGTGSYIGGRPFPYVFYPVVISPYENYYGANEIYVLNDTQRTGGELSSVIIQPANTSISNTANTYRLIGDLPSVNAVYTALLASSPSCGIANSTITPFKPTLNTTAPTPEQVVQYYRASSFALSLDTYNNSASSLANMPTNTSMPLADTPLPTDLDPTFLACLNSTIGESVPLVDLSHKLNGGEIFGIVSSGVFLAGWLTLVILLCTGCCVLGKKVEVDDMMKGMKVEDDPGKTTSASERDAEYKLVGSEGFHDDVSKTEETVRWNY
ncbi:hypothetical protein BD410DRAFT_829258 [Rickenella mellea]|uniref:Uncharacterized protein n=1 Tax=Rickenella mellea TaxID=50990 RepID=A0A4Y7Q067_9AGAM|nr:hypothetical protein BD410DRAFT_829258 [Rickenella mellea]